MQRKSLNFTDTLKKITTDERMLKVYPNFSQEELKNIPAEIKYCLLSFSFFYDDIESSKNKIVLNSAKLVKKLLTEKQIPIYLVIHLIQYIIENVKNNGKEDLLAKTYGTKLPVFEKAIKDFLKKQIITSESSILESVDTLNILMARKNTSPIIKAYAELPANYQMIIGSTMNKIIQPLDSLKANYENSLKFYDLDNEKKIEYLANLFLISIKDLPEYAEYNALFKSVLVSTESISVKRFLEIKSRIVLFSRLCIAVSSVRDYYMYLQKNRSLNKDTMLRLEKNITADINKFIQQIIKNEIENKVLTDKNILNRIEKISEGIAKIILFLTRNRYLDYFGEMDHFISFFIQDITLKEDYDINFIYQWVKEYFKKLNNKVLSISRSSSAA